MTLFQARIEVDAHVILKNSKTIRHKWGASGRKVPYIGKTQKQKSLMDHLILELRSKSRGIAIAEPVWALFRFIYPMDEYFTKKGRRSKNLPDLSNLYEGPQDALVKAEIIEDDWQIQAHDKSRILAGEKRELIITLFPMSEADKGDL